MDFIFMRGIRRVNRMQRFGNGEAMILPILGRENFRWKCCSSHLNNSIALLSFLTAKGDHWTFVTPWQCFVGCTTKLMVKTDLSLTTGAVEPGEYTYGWHIVNYLFASQNATTHYHPPPFPPPPIAHRSSEWLEVCWRYIRPQYRWCKTMDERIRG